MKKQILIFVVVGLMLAAPSYAFIPNDTQLFQQDYLSRINAYKGWDLMSTEAKQRQVIVAVLDAGVDITHPDLVDNIWVNVGEVPGNGIDDDHNSYIDDANGWDFVESNPDPNPKLDPGYNMDAVEHGTVVAGIIGAEINNDMGIAGLVENVKIMPLRVLDSQGVGSTLTLAQAIDYAVDNGADVINLSLVGSLSDVRMEAAIKRAYQAGVPVIAASGNEEIKGLNLNLTPRYPICDFSDVNMVMGVAALDSNDILASFSNYGFKCVDISAPGTDIFSSLTYSPNDPQLSEYYGGGWQGTSVAAPQVTGVIANIKKLVPNLTIEKIYNSVINSAKSIKDSNPLSYLDLGGGLLDMEASLKTALDLGQQKKTLLVLASLTGQPIITITDQDGMIVNSFFAYNPNFTGGVKVITADVNNDGQQEIVTVPNSNGGPHVRIFDQQGNVVSQFMALDPLFRGGLNVNAGDLDKDGLAEIIISSNGGTPPFVKVFNLRGELQSEFLAYSSFFTGGVNVATEDIDHDGRAEIITSPMSGGGPHVRIFRKDGTLVSQFMAFDATVRSGFPLTAADVNNDRQIDIIVDNRSDNRQKINISSPYGVEENSWFVFPTLYQLTYKVDLLSSDITGDQISDVITYPSDKHGNTIKVFDYTGQLIKDIPIHLINSGGFSLALIQ